MFGLLLGPMVLALLGLVISLEPTWVNRVVLQPAVAAIYGQTVDVKVALWHGLTPMLLLSAVVVGIGTLLFLYWAPIHYRLRTIPLDRYDVEHAYDALLRRIRTVARFIAEWLERQDLRGQLGVIFLAVAAFVVWGLVTSGRPPRLASEVGAVRVGPAALALVGLAGGIAATWARSLLAAMIATGLAGLVAALTFLVNGAPDLALTQFAVESLVVVLLTAALLALPLEAPTTRSSRARRGDAVIAAGLSVLLFVALLDMGVAPQQNEVSAFFGARSYLNAFGRNVVNVILVDFRGFDTLGESTVIALSAVIAWSLLGPRLPLATRSGGARRSAFVLAFASPLFFWLLAALSVIVLYRGHNEIGGGFVGGLTAALAFAIVALAHGVDRAREKLRWHPLTLVGSGLLLAVASGLPGLVMHGDYLRHVWIDVDVLGVHIKQGTALLFDVGVYLAVLGTVLAFLFGLTREAES